MRSAANTGSSVGNCVQNAQQRGEARRRSLARWTSASIPTRAAPILRQQHAALCVYGHDCGRKSRGSSRGHQRALRRRRRATRSNPASASAARPCGRPRTSRASCADECRRRAARAASRAQSRAAADERAPARRASRAFVSHARTGCARQSRCQRANPMTTSTRYSANKPTYRYSSRCQYKYMLKLSMHEPVEPVLEDLARHHVGRHDRRHRDERIEIRETRRRVPAHQPSRDDARARALPPIATHAFATATR